MITLNKKNNSIYKIFIGWAGHVYATSQNDIYNLMNSYGKEKIKIETIKKEIETKWKK